MSTMTFRAGEPGCGGCGALPEPHPLASASVMASPSTGVGSFSSRDIFLPSMNRRWLYALAAITAVGAIVRFATLGVQSYDHDEVVTAARILHPSIFATLREVVDSERNPPLY